jgi:nucleoside-diphosphate-sugar epimerase
VVLDAMFRRRLETFRFPAAAAGRSSLKERIALTDFRDSRVLVTGGLGFIGSNIARRLVGLGAHVTLLDSMVPAYGGNFANIEDIKNNVVVNISDVRDAFSLRHLLQGQQVLFNLAGQTSHMDSMEDPFTDLAINCQSQLSILETCRQINPDVKIVFASTRQIYGRPQYLPVDESHPLSPVDVNGINKVAGEWYHSLYNSVYGIRTCVLRLTNTFGPGMRVKDARQTFVGVWIRNLVEGRPFEVWEGHQLRDFTYVDDVVDAMLNCALYSAADGGVFNVGGPQAISLKELAQLLVRLNGKGEFVTRSFPESRKRIDIGDYYADDKRLRKALGWQPRVSLEEGFRRTLAFYHNRLEHYV